MRSIRNLRKRAPTWIRGSGSDAIIRDLLHRVWGLELGSNVARAGPYLDHYQELRTLVDGDILRVNTDWTEVVELVNLIQTHSQINLHGIDRRATLREIKEVLTAANPKWSVKPLNDELAKRVIDFAIRLWLLIEPDLQDENLTLPQVIRQSLPEPPPSNISCSRNLLSSDFSAKSLSRKGGIRLVWTSSLSDHLTFVGKSQLRIFRHASALREHQRSKRGLFPENLLTETENTLCLLFPPINYKSSKRTRKICEANDVDIEAAIASHASRDLSNYPYWQGRLREIQHVYDDARPQKAKQWWFDRRNKSEWATLWIAILVFVLTLIFGLISSITGILQAYASFKFRQT